MSNAAKHRRRAAEFEQLKQIDRAIALYVKAIESSEAEGEEVDVALLNKVGDLSLRQGRVPEALTYYERAVEHYAASGLFNNAIALCNKILRNAPGRATVYYTLGRICAKKGLRGDATRNFLAYATRMQLEGKIDEGMRVLGEVAELMPELTEVRSLVEEHAVRKGIPLRRAGTPVRSAPAIPISPEALANPFEKTKDLVYLELEYRGPVAAAESGAPMPAAPSGDGASVPEPLPHEAAVESREASIPPLAGLESSAGHLIAPSADVLLPVPELTLELQEIPPIDAAIAAGANLVDRDEAGQVGQVDLEAIDEWIPVSPPPYRIDPHDFILPGELPPLVIDDTVVEVGMARAARLTPRSVEVIPVPVRQLPTPVIPIAAVLAEVAAVVTSRLDELRAAVEREPANWRLRHRFAEALFEAGDREDALSELQRAMSGLLAAGELAAAADIADELVQVSPDRIPFHQKRVELAVQLKDSQRLRLAYLDLADALVQRNEEARARAVYARVLELAPHDDRARAALGAAAPPLPEEAEPVDEYVDLATWLQDDAEPGSTRMRMHEPAVTGDEQADFALLLRHFKEGVARALGEDDYASHYDLGVAYKEMGLLDDAIAEFQRALRSRLHRLPAYEALGQCFVEQERFEVAATMLNRALHEPGVDDAHRVGVLYLLGYSCEALQRIGEARGYYHRVQATSPNFRDVTARLTALDQLAS